MLNSDQQSSFPISTYTLTHAEMLGRNAAKAKELFRSNPYPKDTDEWSSWNDGWKGKGQQKNTALMAEEME